MVLTKRKARREQASLLDACTTSRPAPGARPRRVGIATEVLRDLHTADPTPGADHHRYDPDRLIPPGRLATVPLETASPLPPQLIADTEHVTASRDAACRVLFAEDQRRREDIVTAAWIDDAVSGVMAEHCTAVLDAVTARPGLRHDPALLMALAPIAAMLKGLVA